jgi:hypothetical protein
MPNAIVTKKVEKQSLTDSILKLCASGRFGVREAIAKAAEQQKHSRTVAVEQK